MGGLFQPAMLNLTGGYLQPKKKPPNCCDSTKVDANKKSWLRKGKQKKSHDGSMGRRGIFTYMDVVDFLVVNMQVDVPDLRPNGPMDPSWEMIEPPFSPEI